MTITQNETAAALTSRAASLMRTRRPSDSAAWVAPVSRVTGQPLTVPGAAPIHRGAQRHEETAHATMGGVPTVGPSIRSAGSGCEDLR